MIFQRFIPIWTIILLTACSTTEENKDGDDLHFTQYSEFVKDTFYIDIQLPKAYQETQLL